MSDGWEGAGRRGSAEGDAANDTGQISGRDEGPLFAVPQVERGRSRKVALAVLGAGAVILMALLLVPRRTKPVAQGTVLAADPYAESLEFRGLQMSESTSLSGGKSTYLDGSVRNTGARSVRGVQLQVLFGKDAGLPPQVENLPLALVRTREPYVDTQPVSAAPLAPGDVREFRLIFEDIPANWNQQLPQIRVVSVSAR